METWDSSFGETELPAQPGTYRLAVTATRSVSALSIRIDAAWTFSSARTDQYRPAPILAVRFTPALDRYNRARAGVPYAIPVTVVPQTDAQVGPVRNLTVDVSYNDGDTWKPAFLLGTGAQRTALVHHPHREGFVSLRATATDSLGNRLEQTIIHAYALTG